MADSLSVGFDSPPPKFGVSFEQTMREAKYLDDIQTSTQETKEAYPNIFQKGLAELVGTYVIVFVGCGAGLVSNVEQLNRVGEALAAGLSLTVAIYSVGHISGGHFNPAVSIAAAVARNLPFKLVPIYVLCQLTGAILASLTLKVLYEGQADIRVVVTQYSSSTSHLEALVWEFIATFILMLTICGVAIDHRGSKDLAGLAIGTAVLINVIAVGPITGASMNPARSLGPAIVSGVFKKIGIYIFSPIMGATTASVVYSLLKYPNRIKA
ncbi:hypothetical protein QN277_014927 [Acacia crassicarpa]|uniref:Uncharacterized protein n=1 Tax=Acacia crassicarpa TaxID=499986 RepID=A0AAE1MVA6_9FABA|nr:hypothetical protein QN277_014927 [Acacia crassicarpa]